MQAYYWWWIAAFGLGALELLTGTFYLLVLALGCVAGGLAGWAGLGLSAQIVIGAVVAVLGWAVLARWHRGRHRGIDEARSMQLDIGESVEVTHWGTDGHGHARYRGARWDVVLDGPVGSPAPRPGRYVIRRLDGNRLVVGPVGPSA